jgi:hypothetical protein
VQVPFGIYFIVSGIRTLVIGGSSELGWSHLNVALTIGDIHLQESVPGRRLSKARPIHQEHIIKISPNGFAL